VEDGGNETGRSIAVVDGDADPAHWTVVGGGELCQMDGLFPTPPPSMGKADAFVAKLNAETGNVLWARVLGGTGIDGVWGVAVDSWGTIYATGQFGNNNQAGDFDPGAGTRIFSSTGAKDSFLSHLDADGNYLAAWHTGGDTPPTRASRSPWAPTGPPTW
jgi:hypothetical protein